ncbi:MAG: 30S ribosome-binding factor RbfA [Deltaproteobacteria bacterium]|nr:30S ribosome-binding factor RbfA [Deltaproteobacteria bacterium]MBW2048040.1 30S ribosome-binding factor RbfA [Deltaproteobacteria bacterium]MBW2111369.1 30S ribosome-binding factor RbfA [Deltaproteobacteria bacterium]MBW2354053.1 30S ribosome-binding factor RbfA [Deltaproteobacteria bacterium]HDZ90551.1 30S ribosome-binding factor RbfA [Deltaproteobacteria bacterium]
MLPGKRATRVGDLVLREIAMLLLNKVKDPRVQGVTLTGIHLTNDLKRARVFYSVVGSQQRVEEAGVGLNSARGFIRREVGIRMELRYVPEISFAHDPSLERGSHMEQVFAKIKGNEKQP